MLQEAPVFLTKENLPQHGQEIDGRQDHPHSRHGYNHHPEDQAVGVTGGKPHKHHQLRHKTTHARQGQGGEGAGGPEGKHLAHLLAHASHFIQHEGVGAVIGSPHQEEEAGADEAVADHLQHGATGGQRRKAGHANEHKAHVANGTVGDFAFQVALRKGGQRGINDVDHPQNHQQRRELGMGLGQHLGIEAEQGIATHLEEDAGQEHMNRCGGFSMGIRQPGVEGHDGKLDAKGNEKAGVAEHLEGQSQGLRGNVSIGKAGGTVPLEAHGQPRHQDEQRAACGVEDELGGGVLPFLAPPDGQQQVDGNQLQLPGQEEEQHVLHGKHGHLATAHGQHEHMK